VLLKRKRKSKKRSLRNWEKLMVSCQTPKRNLDMIMGMISMIMMVADIQVKSTFALK
jgi:recombination DNA repair RAD52 pathway protein